MKRWILAFAIMVTAADAMGTASSPIVGAGWDDMKFPANRLATGASNPPTYAQYANDGATSVGVYALRFDYQGTAGNEEQAWFTGQFSHQWREESTINIHAHVSPENTTACNFRLCVEYLLGRPVQNFQATTTTVCATFASDQVILKQQLESIADVVMTGYTLSTMIHGRIFRNSSHSEDTCTATGLWLHELDIHFEIDQPGGSRQRTTK